MTLKREADLLRLVIADDGIGLPADYRQGRGYGMKLVAAMVAQVNGALEVQNDAGSRFALSLPADACSPSVPKPRPSVV